MLLSTGAYAEQRHDLPGVEMTEASIMHFWETWQGPTQVYGQASRAAMDQGFSPADRENSFILSTHIDRAFLNAGFSYAKTLENYTRWNLGLEGAYGDDEMPHGLFSGSGLNLSIRAMKEAIRAGVHFDLVDEGVFTPEQAEFLWIYWRQGSAG